MTHIHDAVLTVGELIVLLDGVDASIPIRVIASLPAVLTWRDQDFETHLVGIECTDVRQ